MVKGVNNVNTNGWAHGSKSSMHVAQD